MKKLSETLLKDEVAMRAFYESCGISQATIEAAIETRRKTPLTLEREIRRIKHVGRRKRTTRTRTR